MEHSGYILYTEIEAAQWRQRKISTIFFSLNIKTFSKVWKKNN